MENGHRTMLHHCDRWTICQIAIGGRAHFGMNNSICDEAWPKSLNERFILKHVAAVCRGGIHIGSCYLTSCSAGAKGQRNLDTLQVVAGYSVVLKAPGR